jgi:ParB family chromosome partitioning protein
LLALEGAAQSEAARDVAAKGYSVRETEQLVRRLGSASPAKAKKTNTSLDPDIKRLQDELAEKLAAKVLFQHAAKGNGKLVIHYNNLDELEGILQRIQ